MWHIGAPHTPLLLLRQCKGPPLDLYLVLYLIPFRPVGPGGSEPWCFKVFVCGERFGIPVAAEACSTQEGLAARLQGTLGGCGGCGGGGEGAAGQQQQQQQGWGSGPGVSFCIVTRGGEVLSFPAQQRQAAGEEGARGSGEAEWRAGVRQAARVYAMLANGAS